MEKTNSFFQNQKVLKIILILLIIIILVVGLFFIFSPTNQLVKKLGNINGKSYDLEKGKQASAYLNNCRIAVWPTDNLFEPNLTQGNQNQHTLFLYVNSQTNTNKGSISISVISTEDYSSLTSELNEISNNLPPRISKKYDTFNYFAYNGKNYYYNLNSNGGIMFVTPINNNYLYWVMVSNYKNLSQKDIESILYFEVI